MEGVKFDNKKIRPSLLPAKALSEVVKVLDFGADKYEVDNWKKLPDMEERCLDAGLRHLLWHSAGEVFDEESGISHLAHAVTNLLFILEGSNECPSTYLTATLVTRPPIPKKCGK